MSNKTLTIGGIIIAVAVVAAVFITTALGKIEKPYDYNLDEYIELGEYKDLPFVKPVAEITDEQVESEINSRLRSASTTEKVTEGVVEDGDSINIAFVGKIDGEEFEGGSSESYDLTVGVTSMIDGFVEGLIGKNIGETVTEYLKFPEEYHSEEVAGKDVVFEVTINHKNVTTVPEFDLDFVKANSECETIEEYKAEVKEELRVRQQKNLEDNIKNTVWSWVLGDSKAIKYPDAELKKSMDNAAAMEQEYKSQASMYGVEWEEYLSTFMGMDEAEFATMLEEYAYDAVKAEMVVYQIARKENVKLSDKDYNKRLIEILEENGFTEETFQASYGMTIQDYADQNGWRSTILLEKVMDKVMALGREVTQEEFDAYAEQFELDHAEEETEE